MARKADALAPRPPPLPRPLPRPPPLPPPRPPACCARPGDGVSTRAVVSSAPRTDVVTPRQSVDLAAVSFGARIGLSSSESDESSLPSWTWTCTLCVPLPLATAALMSPRVVVSSIVRSGSGARGACGSSRATIRSIECLAGRSRGRSATVASDPRPGMSRGRRRRRRGAWTRASRSRVRSASEF